MEIERDLLTERVIGLAIEVHRILGPGLQESVYESALHYELETAGIECRRQVAIDVMYKGRPMGIGLRVDLMIDRTLPIESGRATDGTAQGPAAVVPLLTEVETGAAHQLQCDTAQKR